MTGLPEPSDVPGPPEGPSPPSATELEPATRLGRATGVGSMPGEDVEAALSVVLGELADAPHLPHLPELPARGPGADMLGRAAVLLVDLPVDLQPSGWRLLGPAARGGRDLNRAAAWLRHDLDALAEAADGYTGGLKVQVSGPWTLCAGLWLPRGERVATDRGARADLVASLAEGLAGHLRQVARLVPGARLVVQLDEPSLVDVLDGRLPTASGYGRARAVAEHEVRAGLAAVLAAAEGAGATPVVHCCAAGAPVSLLHRAGARAVSLDVALLDKAGWEAVAEAVEAQVGVYAGVLPVTGPLPGVASVVTALRRRWHALGLPVASLSALAVTPRCGLAGADPGRAREMLGRLRQVGSALTDVVAEG